MGQDKFKLLSDIKSRRNNVRLDEIVKLMLMFGFEQRVTKEGIRFRHIMYPDLWASVAKHKEKGQGKQIYSCYVNNCIKAIMRLMEYEEERSNDNG